MEGVMDTAGAPADRLHAARAPRPYRISLFSQPMKTAVPISKERLNKLWQQLP